MNYFQTIISQVGIFYFVAQIKTSWLRTESLSSSELCVLDVIPTNFNFLIFATLDLPMDPLTMQTDWTVLKLRAYKWHCDKLMWETFLILAKQGFSSGSTHSWGWLRLLHTPLLPAVFLGVAIDLALVACFWGQGVFLIHLRVRREVLSFVEAHPRDTVAVRQEETRLDIIVSSASPKSLHKHGSHGASAEPLFLNLLRECQMALS